MLRFLLLRPIAVIMVMIALLAVGVLSFVQLPVSLLPDIDVPEIMISVQYPNSSPEEIEQNVLKPIRENMLTINGLKSLESLAQQESGTVSLQMQYGTNMNLAYIEVNEKIDRLTSSLPSTLDRPQVVKANTSDIPVARIQIVPARDEDQLVTSDLAINILKRRLEQLEGIGLVDINGTQQAVIRISPDYAAMRSLNLTDADIIQTVEGANLDLGSLSVRDGNYRYFLNLASNLSDPSELEKLPIKIPGSNKIVRLQQIAAVYAEAEKARGFHLFNAHQGIVITIHKQAQARMPEVMPKVYETINMFRAEYPAIDFQVTQDQSLLLTLSIQNLSQALIWGGLFAFGVLFVFMGGWREPLVMGVVLPISLVLCFSLLYLCHISLNIISLSGLALGLGMLVDNSIVVIDNIVIKRKEGTSLIDSCVNGTQEVLAPLISSALTNLAVFIPLIFMSGITGALFYDQAIAVTCILFVSILCTFIFVPLLYSILNRNREVTNREDSTLFLWLREKYHRSFLFVWAHKTTSLIVMAALIPVSIILLIAIPKEGFPEIGRTESVIDIDWNEPIDVQESRKRVIQFLTDHKLIIEQSEAEVGFQQFILSTSKNSAQQAKLYIRFSSQEQKNKSEFAMRKYLLRYFPTSSVVFSNAPNAFEQLFVSSSPLYEVRLRDPKSKRPIPIETANILAHSEKHQGRIGKGFEIEDMVFMTLDFSKMRLYGVNFNILTQKLKIVFGDYRITNLKNFGDVIPVMFSGSFNDLETVMRSTEVPSENGKMYPLREFVTATYEQHYKNITADASGIFQAITMDSVNNEKELRAELQTMANENNLTADFTGTLFDKQKNLRQLLFILLISFAVMYFIITAEFESFTQPLMVMLSIPIGFAGSLLLLGACGGTINIMSGIGLVVVLGILDNDAILKIDRINNLQKLMPLDLAIPQAGLERFKPIVMNTCTNVLALVPIIFSSGLGADLQRPVAITTIGGLIFGTFAALYFIPLVYWVMKKK